jgi:hypothetical protein
MTEEMKRGVNQIKSKSDCVVGADKKLTKQFHEMFNLNPNLLFNVLVSL